MSGRGIALLHPGAMGVTVGATLTASGHAVRWLTEGRSNATRQRAETAGLHACDTLTALLDGTAAVISVCPPAAALALAERVAATGFDGLYVDANAVSPDTVRRIEKLYQSRVVDGGIVGPPAERPGTTRLYLSGPGAPQVADWFQAGPLAARVLEGPVGAASALKMSYAAYTKGSTALLLAIRALAEAEGVTGALLAEWSLSQPGLHERSDAMAGRTAGKARRFVGEMHEIADTFQSAGLPDGFHRAAADVYRRMAELDDATATAADVIGRLLPPES